MYRQCRFVYKNFSKMKLFTERMNEMIVESTQNTLSSFFENPTQSAFIVPVSLFEVSIKRKTE